MDQLYNYVVSYVKTPFTQALIIYNRVHQLTIDYDQMISETFSSNVGEILTDSTLQPITTDETGEFR